MLRWRCCSTSSPSIPRPWRESSRPWWQATADICDPPAYRAQRGVRGTSRRASACRSEDTVSDDRLTALFDGQRKTSLAWRTSTAAERVERIKRLLASVRRHRADILAAAAADFNRPAAEVTLTELVGITREAKTAVRRT